MARVEGGAVIIQTDWPGLKSQIDDRNINFKFEEDATAYEIFAIDGQYFYSTVIYKSGQAPQDQATYDTWRADFESNYKNRITDFTSTDPFFLTNVDGYSVVLKDGATPTANDGYGIAVIGYDGSNYRMLKSDSSGRPVLVGAGSAGTPVGGVLSIQGVTSGTAVTVSGTVTANAGSGNFAVVQATASNLLASVGGLGAAGAAVVGFPVRIGGSDGVNTQDILIDSSGRQIIVGAAAAGAAPVGNPVLIAGSDGSSVRSIRTASDGTVRIDPTGTTIQPVSGTVTANAGSGTFTVSGTVTSNIGTTGGLALDATLVKLTISPGTALGSNTLAMVGGSVTTVAPTYTNGNINPISLTTAGAIRIDGSGVTQPVSGTVTSNQGTSPWVENVSQFGGNNVVTGTGASGAGIPRVTVSNDSNVLATQSGTWTVQQGSPPWSVAGTAADGAAVSGNPVRIGGSDGTNTQNITTDTSGRLLVSGAAAAGAAVTGNPVLIAGQDGTNVQSILTDPRGDQYIVNYGAPSDSLRGLSFGRVTGSANTLQAVRATAYSQPTANAQRSVSSTNAGDTSAGTGARQIRITYYTATMTGPFTETITLNGTTPVNTSNTNICFIERMEVMSIGSTGSNIGIITLFGSTGGGGGLIGTIGINNIVNGRGDNHTLWAHHYVAAGVTANITSYACGSNGNQGNASFLMALDPTVSTSPEKIISDALATSASTLSVVRNLIVPIRISGPSRITLFIVPLGSNTNFFGGFDFWEL